jgi:hypothetical protein
MGGACSTYGGRGETYARFWWVNLREDGSIKLRWIFRKWDVGVWTGLSMLRIETGGGLF